MDSYQRRSVRHISKLRMVNDSVATASHSQQRRERLHAVAGRRLCRLFPNRSIIRKEKKVPFGKNHE
jgi:hypothetical protein